MMDDWPGDFASLDPWERFNAHQRAKGRDPVSNPDVLKRLRENYDAIKDAKSEARYVDDPQAENDSQWRETLPEKGCGA